MRRLGLTVSTATILLALCAGTAMAGGAKKEPLYGPDPIRDCASGVFETSEVFGTASLRSAGKSGTSVVGKIVLKGATPNATFSVQIWQGPPDECEFTDLGELQTNRKGDGRFSFATGHEAADTVSWVYLAEEGPEPAEHFGSPAVELG